MPESRALSARLLAAYAVAFVVVIGALGVVVDQAVRAALLRQLVDDLSVSAGFVASRLGDDPGAAVDGLAGIEQARITLIALDGTVVSDTAENPGSMENHGGRPEVLAALSGEVGSARRVSATISQPLLYVAIPPIPGSDVLVRLAVSEESVAERLAAFRRSVAMSTAIAGLFGIAAVWFLGRRIAAPIRTLTERAEQVAGGARTAIGEEFSITELTALGEALDGMAADLQMRIASAQTARAELETVLGALPVGVLVVEPDGSVSYSNPRARDLLLAPGGDVVPVMPHSFRLVLDEAAAGASARGSHTLGSPPRVLEISALRLDGARVLALIEDRTEIERTDTIRREFVAAASHELKTPVASVRAAAEALLLALDRDPERVREFAGLIADSSGQLARLASDLLDLSRLEVSEMPFEVVDLGAIAVQVSEEARLRCEEAGLTLVVDVSTVAVDGSHADLALAVRNLLDNACRFTESGGLVTVEVSRVGEDAKLVVSDTGAGIPVRSIPRVFERFYRVDAARSRATGGTGLGLAIVKHVVERHGGAVGIRSVLGRGSTFTVTLPARHPPESS